MEFDCPMNYFRLALKSDLEGVTVEGVPYCNRVIVAFHGLHLGDGNPARQIDPKSVILSGHGLRGTTKGIFRFVPL